MFNLSDVANAIKGKANQTVENVKAKAIATDTRTIRKGELFFALQGPNFDGHNFIGEALKKGAVGAAVSKDIKCDRITIKVKDTLLALGDLARWYRSAIKAKVVTITGSNGKTTTKDMVAHLLECLGRKVVKAKGSFNNFIGLPLTILSAGDETEFVILEAGTNKGGEIKYLGEIANPDVAVITNVSEAHLEGLGSIENIAKEKASLLACLKPDGFAVLNIDNKFVDLMAETHKGRVITYGFDKNANFRAMHLKRESGKVVFNVNTNFDIILNLSGWWNIHNALASMATIAALGINPKSCIEAFATFAAPKMRMQKVKIGVITFINDAYNSNPVSACGAIEEFAGMQSVGRKVLVIGDMKELGAFSEMAHRALGGHIARQKDIIIVIGVGSEIKNTLFAISNKEKHHYANVGEAGKDIKNILKNDDLVLLKASRSVGLEKILDYFKE